MKKLTSFITQLLRVAMTTQYIPAGLWEGIQEICFRKDQDFIKDIARIIGVPAIDIKRKVLGTRGVPMVIPEAQGPWWLNCACPIMERTGYIFKRCLHPMESHGACWQHKEGGVRFDDEQFIGIETRVPFRYLGELYWVAKDGSVLNGLGMPITTFTVDLEYRTVKMSECGKQVP